MNYIWLKTNQKNQNRLNLKCFQKNIFIYDTYLKNNFFFFKINLSDLKKLQKEVFIDCQIEKITGPKKSFQTIKKYHIFLINLILGLIIFFFLSHIIVDVQIIHSSSEINNLLQNALENYGIKKNTWKKDYQTLKKIKEEILNQYPEKLEWLEIETKGMKYIIRLEERKIVSEEKSLENCHIIANKDALVKKIIYDKGEALVKTNDYVKKGDILITGIIKKDEEIKKEICARGTVYGEVWYKINITIPKKTTTQKETGKVRWNLTYQKNSEENLVFKSRIENYTTQKYHLFTIWGLSLYFTKQYEVEEITKEKTIEELTNEANETVKEKLKNQFTNGEVILEQKILQKTNQSDNINMQFFVTTLEKISEEKEYQVEEIKNNEQ